MIHMSEGNFNKMQGNPKKKPRFNGHIAYRVDRNQAEIVATLRKLGFTVRHLHSVGGGIFDLIVCKWGLNVLIEVKDSLKSPSQRKLTTPQEKFNFEWQGMKCVVICKQDCISINEQLSKIALEIYKAGITLDVVGCRESMYEPKLY